MKFINITLVIKFNVANTPLTVVTSKKVMV